MSRVLSVPYVPILGPAHPDQFNAEMFTDVFADILTASSTGTTLPFDKDRRWSPRKTDTILIDEVVHRPDHTIIPVLSRRGSGTVKTFYYGHNPDLDALRAATRRCCTTYGAANGRVVWFDTDEAADADRTRVLLKEFTHDQPDTPAGEHTVGELDACAPDVAASFEAFAHAMADHGFDFLHRRRSAGRFDGPVLVSEVDGAVVGAIGPLTIMPDRSGSRMLLPQYFGVLPGQRGNSHGRALWRAAERWGTQHQADYQLLQTRAGYASDRLFLSEGLRSLGFAATVAA
ncbi:MAG: GNAT family N-acetyltransferase [Actinophytocola sp.]|nr:GNAT family N-acetyltransferase [Actinophytocola sp.]